MTPPVVINVQLTRSLGVENKGMRSGMKKECFSICISEDTHTHNIGNAR